MASKRPPPPDYDDNPEWTDEDFARARPAAEVLPPEAVERLVRGRGRPPKADAKVQVSLRLDPDVLARLKAEGPGWQGRVNTVLRAALDAKTPPG